MVNEAIRSEAAGDSTYVSTYFPKTQLPFKLPDCL